MRVNALRDPAAEYTCTEFGVDSSSGFSFRARTHTQTQMPLITVPTHRLVPAWVTQGPLLGSVQSVRCERGLRLLTDCGSHVAFSRACRTKRFQSYASNYCILT